MLAIANGVVVDPAQRISGVGVALLDLAGERPVRISFVRDRASSFGKSSGLVASS